MNKIKEENIKKYGKPNNDIISIQKQMNDLCFVGFCFGNIQKYLKRYISDSWKAGNDYDIAKVLDYANRLSILDIDLKRFKTLIKNKDYKTAFIHSIDIQELYLKTN